MLCLGNDANTFKNVCKERERVASPVVQWFRICLPMQGTRVWSLVWKDATCHGATKPVCHNCWAHVPWSPCSTTRDAAAVRSAPQQVSLHSLHLEATCAPLQGPSAAENRKGNGVNCLPCWRLLYSECSPASLLLFLAASEGALVRF